MNIGGAHQILNAVNDALRERGRAPLFRVELVGLNRHASQPSGIFEINPNVLIDEVPETFMIDIDKESQSPLIIFQGQRDHGDDSVKRAQAYIEEHYAEKLSVARVADEVGMDRRNLERRFRRATTNTLIEYIQRVRVEAAKRRFERSSATILEVMCDVGYSDIKAFRTVFKRIAGMTPADYRRKYNRHAVELAPA